MFVGTRKKSSKWWCKLIVALNSCIKIKLWICCTVSYLRQKSFIVFVPVHWRIPQHFARIWRRSSLLLMPRVSVSDTATTIACFTSTKPDRAIRCRIKQSSDQCGRILPDWRCTALNVATGSSRIREFSFSRETSLWFEIARNGKTFFKIRSNALSEPDNKCSSLYLNPCQFSKAYVLACKVYPASYLSH